MKLVAETTGIFNEHDNVVAGVRPLVATLWFSTEPGPPTEFGLEYCDLVRFSTEARFEPHRVIFDKGDPGDCLYGILAGRVRIYSTSRVLRGFRFCPAFNGDLIRASGDRTVTWWQAAQSTFTKPPDPRSSICAA